MKNNKYKIKYAYWKFAILKEIYKKEKQLVVIHNIIEDTISVWDIGRCKRTIQPTQKELDIIYNNYLISNLITVDNVEEFYKSLPVDKQKTFWQCVNRGV